MKSFHIAAALLAASITMSGTADAAPVNITGSAAFTSFESFRDPTTSGGVHGLELRGGFAALNQTWQQALGSATSVNARMDNRSGFDWDGASPWNFELSYGGTSNEFRIWSGDTRPDAASLSFDDLSLGNAIRISTARSATITLTGIDGTPFALTVGEIGSSAFNGAILYSEGFRNGFVLSGTLDVTKGGNAANRIGIEAGNVAPIPLPAAAWLLLSGLAGIGLLGRRRRAA